MRSLGIAVAAVILLSALPARAQADTEMATALADFAAAEKELTLTAPCDSMCKALQSMTRAADRICELARDGTASDQKRCSDAKQKIAEATARVRAACPDCNPSPPYAPSTTPPPVGKQPMPSAGKAETEPGKVADQAGTVPASPVAEEAKLSYRVAGVAGSGRNGSLMLDVLPVFAPPWVIQARFERRVVSVISIVLNVGYGSLPKDGPEGRSRSSVLALGGEVRGYVFGGMDSFGLFVGADLIHRSAALLYQEELTTKTFPVGVTAGAVVGTKLVSRAGFSLEARAGASYIVQDQRFGRGTRLLPHGGVSLGWTF